MRLESWYIPGDGAASMRLRLVNDGDTTVGGFELTFTTIVQLDPLPPARLVARRSGCHVVAPPDETSLAPGAVWELTATCGHRPRHANDGPASAFLTLADGTTVGVATGPARRVAVGPAAPLTFHADPASDVAGRAMAAVAARDARLHPYRPTVFMPTGEHTVSATVDESLADDVFSIAEHGGGCALAGGSAVALQQAMTALVRAARATDAAPVPVGRAAAVHGWRGLHIDLARRFFPAADLEWLVDVAAWHGLNRLHLHLTDDEAWRIPVPDYPALTERGAWRGAGRPIPPLLGSGAGAYGGAYTWDDVARWHARAADTGLVLIPEIDLPGHCFAALAAVPTLVDPDDTSGAVSVQHFADNVLNPGVDETWRVLEAAFGGLAEHFPSPWLHLGGDEVATGAWSGSPLAQAWGTTHGAATSDEIGALFLGAVIDLVRRTTGRLVGVWQEGALSGALAPDDGYVVGWRSGEACQRLAADGYDVVAAPAEAYYLDMAASPEWYEPGAGWAGHTSVADVVAFDPADGWSAAERARLLGVQACLWTECVPDRPTMERLLFPRLTAFATAAWPGPT